MSHSPSVFELMRPIKNILRIRDPKRRSKLLKDCLRISFKYAILVKLFGYKFNEESVLDYQVLFFSYEAFYTLFEELFAGGVYLLDCERPDPFILDGGSNIGMSILFFKSLYPSARIVAFEPGLETFKMLQRNIDANRLTGVELHNTALGGTSGETIFHYLENDPGWLSQSATASLSNRSATRPVRVETLSPYISEEVDILKLDIEGAEDDVLSELEVSGKLTYIRKMILEYHHHMNTQTDRLGTFLTTLEKNGFGYQFKSNAPLPFPTAERQWFLLYAYTKAAIQSPVTARK